MEVSINAVNRIGIPVSDVDKAAQWYKDVLGAILSPYSDEFLQPFSLPEMTSLDFMLMRTAEPHRLRFSSADRKWTYAVIKFSTTCDIRTLYDAMGNRGVRVWGLYETEDGPISFFFEDLEGNQFCMGQNPQQAT